VYCGRNDDWSKTRSLPEALLEIFGPHLSFCKLIRNARFILNRKFTEGIRLRNPRNMFLSVTFQTVLVYFMMENDPLEVEGQPLPPSAYKVGRILTYLAILWVPAYATLRLVFMPQGRTIKEVCYFTPF
jgi:hypothetical protein